MTHFKRILAYSLVGGSALLTSLAVSASDLSSDLDSLGGNDEIIERARALDPNNRVRIVQNRQVDRYNRLEVALRGGLISGGQTYLETNEYSGTLTFHFTPRWSIGATASTYRFALTPEGEKRFAAAEAIAAQGHSLYDAPQLNYPDQSATLNLSWYPIYGKTNLFDITTAQFDFYVQGGVGQISFTSPYSHESMAGTTSSNLYSIGTGVGLWLTQHLSTRLELRHEMFKDKVLTGERDLNWTTISTSIGFLL